MKRAALSVSIGVFFSLSSCPSLFRSCGCILMTVTEAFRGHETDLSATLTLRYFSLIIKLPRVSYLFLPLSFVHCSDFISHFLISHPPLSLRLSPLLSIFPSVPLVFHSPSPPSFVSLSFFPPTPLSREAFDAELISIRLGHSSALCRSLSSEQEARSIRWLNGWIARESSSAWRDKGIFFEWVAVLRVTKGGKGVCGRDE